jgi:hypothetical protein
MRIRPSQAAITSARPAALPPNIGRLGGRLLLLLLLLLVLQRLCLHHCCFLSPGG